MSRIARALSLPLAAALVVAAPVHAQPTPAQIALPSEPVHRASDHFPITNEARQDLWFDAIEGRGGAYLGVGADQNYTLAAVQQAELAFVLDYDPIVTRLHRSLMALVADCRAAACVVDALAPEAEVASRRLVARAVGESWEGRQTVRTFASHRPLLRQRALAQAADAESWLGHAGRYAHVRAMVRGGRIRVATGDLTGAVTMRAIARQAAEASVPFRVVYLSNAEEYFDYTPRFADNLGALESDDAIVLRTLRDHRLPRPRGDGGWHYQTQPLSELRARLAAGYADSSWIVEDTLSAAGVRRGSPPGEVGLSALAGVAPRTHAGAARWWLSETHAPRVRPGPRRSSRLLVAARRALAPRLPAAQRARAAAIDLEGTALSRLGRATLGADPHTSEPLPLSGAPLPGASPEVDVPEEALLALLFDGVTRVLLPQLFDAAGQSESARMLRAAPMAADLYAAYRLRDRLVELCPQRATDTHLRACRAATRMIRPARTRRGRPNWSERRGRIGVALRRLAELGADPEASVDLLEDLAHIARATH